MITRYTILTLTWAIRRLLEYDGTISKLEKEQLEKALDTIGTWKEYPMTQSVFCPHCNNNFEVLLPVC